MQGQHYSRVVDKHFLVDLAADMLLDYAPDGLSLETEYRCCGLSPTLGNEVTLLCFDLRTWDYSTSQAMASATFVTVLSPEASGGSLITRLTGTRNGQTINGLQAPGASIPGNEQYTVDDLVYLGPGPQLSSNGFGFSLANGTFSNPSLQIFYRHPDTLNPFRVQAWGIQNWRLGFSNACNHTRAGHVCLGSRSAPYSACSSKKRHLTV